MNVHNKTNVIKYSDDESSTQAWDNASWVPRTHHRPEGSCAQNVRKLPPAKAASKSSFYFYMHTSHLIIFIFYTPFKWVKYPNTLSDNKNTTQMLIFNLTNILCIIV